jgi:hypothetical protein
MDAGMDRPDGRRRRWRSSGRPAFDPPATSFDAAFSSGR